MRSLILMPSRALGGAEKLAAVMACSLGEQGDSVSYVTGFSQANELLREELAAAGIIVEDCDLEVDTRKNSGVRLVTGFWRCWRLLRRMRPDQVMVYLPWPTVALGAILALALARVPSLLIFQLVPPEFLVGRRHCHLLQWAMARSSMGAVAVCGENRRILIEKMGLPAAGIEVVYNGAPTVGKIDAAERDAGRQHLAKWELDGASPLLCGVGRLCSQKGFDLIPPVLPHLRQEFPGLRCLLLGAAEPAYEHELEASLARLELRGVIVKPGAVANVSGIIAHADIFLFPSRFEGHSLALTEAMAAGLSIVTSDASGISEVIRHGREGLVFRSGDSCDMMEKIRWALRHPDQMREMGAAARSRQAEYTQEKMIEGTLAIMQRLENGSRAL